jgi:hypothetical protein
MRVVGIGVKSEIIAGNTETLRQPLKFRGELY